MDRERIEVMRRVMKAMRHPNARVPLADYNAEGGRQVVICLPGDTLEYVSTRVMAVGGAATVVTPTGEGLVPLSWEIGVAPERLFDGEQPLHPTATLGLLLDYFAARGEQTLSFHISFGEVDVREFTPISVPV